MNLSRRRRLFDFLAAMLRRDADARPPLAWNDPALWKAIIPLADLHLVTQALPTPLKAMGRWQDLPADGAEFLSSLNALSTARNEAIRAQGLQAIAILGRAGIIASPLKGLAYDLTQLDADDPGRRLSVDIDLLVGADAAPDAQSILISAGYRALSDQHADNNVIGPGHHLQPLTPDVEQHGPVPVEIHFRLGGAKHQSLLPAKAILATATEIQVSGQPVRVPNDASLLDHAIVHSGLQHDQMGRRTLRLRDAHDIARLWGRMQSAGTDLSALRTSNDVEAMKHFGACLLVTGASIHRLGPHARPAKRYFRTVLWRQGIPERLALEQQLVNRMRLLRTNPLVFAIRLFSVRQYKTMRRLLRQPSK